MPKLQIPKTSQNVDLMAREKNGLIIEKKAKNNLFKVILKFTQSYDVSLNIYLVSMV